MSKVHIHLNYDDLSTEPGKLQELMTLIDATYHIHVEGKRNWWYLTERELAAAIGQADQFEAKHDRQAECAESINSRQACKQGDPEARSA